MASPPGLDTREPVALTPFCVMWAATLLLDLLCFPQWLGSASGVALALSAGAVLADPTASGRVVLMLVAQLVNLYVQSPITPNHVLFEGFVTLAILLVVARHWSRPDARARVAAEVTPILRALLIALYAFACLHKLNRDFLAPATSCAGVMLGGIVQRVGLPMPGESWSALAVPLSFAAEGGIPLLLLFPATRPLALLVAWPFHVILSLHPRPGIPAFSSMLFTLLALFLPASAYGAVLAHPVGQRAKAYAAWLRPYWPRIVFGSIVTLAAGVEGISLITSAPLGVSLDRWVGRVGLMLWLPYATALLVALLLALPAAWRDGRPRERLSLRTPALAALVLFLVNGMAPYLGLHTLRTLAMFSNLRTEGGRTNHLFIPTSWQIADYQDDLVRLVESSDPWLSAWAANESLLPFTEVRRRAWEHPEVPMRVTYERNGRIEVLDTSRPDAARLAPPVPFPLHKIMAFREVDQDGHAKRCLW